MKGEKDALWEPLKHVGSPTAKPEGDMGVREVGGKGTIAVGGPTESDEFAAKPPKTIGHDAANPTLEDVEGGDLPKDPKGETSGAYAKEMGTGKEKLSPMAQPTTNVVGKARKVRQGY